jgi:circadian clock protein KaiC
MLSERVKVGIEGFDDLVQGGLPRGSVTLLTGSAGTGKSTFGMQFLYKGAKVYDEAGLYVTLQQSPDSLVSDMRKFGFDLDSLKTAGRFKILDMSPPVSGQVRNISSNVLIESIEFITRTFHPKRIVVDPISIFGFVSENALDLNQNLLRFSGYLKQLEATVLLVTEIPEDSNSLSRFGIEEFVCDGVIVLYYSRLGGLRLRGIEVRKMRGTSHFEGIFPLKVTQSGVVVYPSGKLSFKAGAGAAITSSSPTKKF